jgi:hypothetical protein
MMWRHGDILIARADALPPGARPRPGQVLAYGEITGHSHRVKEQGAAELWEGGGVLFLRVVDAEATLIHEEHLPIRLPRGVYRVWRQREYTPHAIRTVTD